MRTLVNAHDTVKDFDCSLVLSPAPWCPASPYYSPTAAAVRQLESEDTEDSSSLRKQQRVQSPYYMSCTYIGGYEPHRIQGASFGSPDGPHLQSELNNAQTSEQVSGRTRQHRRRQQDRSEGSLFHLDMPPMYGGPNAHYSDNAESVTTLEAVNARRRQEGDESP